MLDCREDVSDNLVEIVVDGRVSRAEFDAVAARLEAAIARHGKLHVLEVVETFGGIDPSAFWADLKFGLRHPTTSAAARWSATSTGSRPSPRAWTR